MGHLYGVAAEMELHSAALDAGIEYYRDGGLNYIRRRFTASAALQLREGLTNASLWPDYPLIRDAAHRNGVLSLAYLALSVPPVGRMIVAESIRQQSCRRRVVMAAAFNILHLPRRRPCSARTLCIAAAFASRRMRASSTGRGATRSARRALPNPDVQAWSGARDAMGAAARGRPALPGGGCRAWCTLSLFGAWLDGPGPGGGVAGAGLDKEGYILSQCYDGHHQIGTTRMGLSERDGVVDRDCRVFGAANLFVAGSSVFPTSGEANPTLTAVALAMRLAALLAAEAPQVAA